LCSAEGVICATKSPIVISIVHALANPTLQQALVFTRDYIISISSLSALVLAIFLAVVAFFKNNTIGRLALISLMFLSIVFLLYDYIRPSEDFSILHPKEGDKISEVEPIYGTKTYDPLCPFVVLYVNDDSGGSRPFRITDVAQIDDVGTWSLQANLTNVKSTKVTLFVGLSRHPPHEKLQEDLSVPPELEHVRSVDVYVVRQSPSLAPD
jgi:hypothetical protein